MKGVVLAGGLGKRLYPLTRVNNKHLLHIYNDLMISYPLRTLLKAGIKDVMIVTGGPHQGNFQWLANRAVRKELGLKKLEFEKQEGEGGISDALSLCGDFVGNDSVAVILGDNTTDADISGAVKSFKDGALIFLKEVPDPERFGVPVFDGKGSIIAIEEKPKEPKSRFAVTGLYLYDSTVFDRIRKVKPSARGEKEITDVNNLYIADGKLFWAKLEGFWRDGGTFETLLESNLWWGLKSGYPIERLLYLIAEHMASASK